MAESSSYVLIQKDESTQTFPVSKCNLDEQAGLVSCQPIRTLQAAEVSLIKKSLAQTIRQQNFETGIIVVGGAAVGVALGAAGGLYLGGPAGIAIAGALAPGFDTVVEGVVYGT